MELAHGLVMLLICAWIVFLEWGSRRSLSAFAARKLCHAGCGAGIMLLDSGVWQCRVFVWLVASSSIAMTWGLSPLPAFRFSEPRDIGVTAYLILVSAWFYLVLPPPILAPLFFADPAGAVVGKWATRNLPCNPRVYQQKTLCGSLAVLLLTPPPAGGTRGPVRWWRAADNPHQAYPNRVAPTVFLTVQVLHRRLPVQAG